MPDLPTVGDRVKVWMHEAGRRYSRTHPLVAVVGTVTGIDTGVLPGVEVRLSRAVNGIDTCYATYDEVEVLTHA